MDVIQWAWAHQALQIEFVYTTQERLQVEDGDTHLQEQGQDVARLRLDEFWQVASEVSSLSASSGIVKRAKWLASRFSITISSNHIGTITHVVARRDIDRKLALARRASIRSDADMVVSEAKAIGAMLELPVADLNRDELVAIDQREASDYLKLASRRPLFVGTSIWRSEVIGLERDQELTSTEKMAINFTHGYYERLFQPTLKPYDTLGTQSYPLI